MLFAWLLIFHLIFHKGFLTEAGLECTAGCHWPWECVEEKKCEEITQSTENSVGSVKWVFLFFFSVEPPWVFMACLSPEVFPFQICKGGFQILFLKCQLWDTKASEPPLAQVSLLLSQTWNPANFNLRVKIHCLMSTKESRGLQNKIAWEHALF